MDNTNIEIRRDQWKQLNARKGPGDSMKDVVDRLLEDDDRDGDLDDVDDRDEDLDDVDDDRDRAQLALGEERVLVESAQVQPDWDGASFEAGDDLDVDDDRVAGRDEDRSSGLDLDDDRPDRDVADVADEDLEEIVDDVAADWYGGTVQDRREAALAGLLWLREHGGPASADRFKNELLPEYRIESQSADTWWRTSVRPALREAQDRGLADYQHGRHVYRWVTE